VGVVDFVLDWDIQTIIMVAGILAAVSLVGSFGVAYAWRKWKERRRHQRAMKGRPPPPAPSPEPSAARTKIRKLGPFGAQRK
jgi:hypothetical protein